MRNWIPTESPLFAKKSIYFTGIRTCCCPSLDSAKSCAWTAHNRGSQDSHLRGRKKEFRHFLTGGGDQKSSRIQPLWESSPPFLGIFASPPPGMQAVRPFIGMLLFGKKTVFYFSNPECRWWHQQRRVLRLSKEEEKGG